MQENERESAEKVDFAGKLKGNSGYVSAISRLNSKKRHRSEQKRYRGTAEFRYPDRIPLNG